MFDPSASSAQVIGALATHLNEHGHLRKLVRGWQRTVHFDVDGERFVIQTGDDGVRLEPIVDADARADIGFTMDHRTLLQLAREEITPIAAKMSGRITSRGSLIEILRFVSILSATIKDHNGTAANRP